MSLLTSPSKRFTRLLLLLALPLLLFSFAFMPPDEDEGLKIGKELPLTERSMPAIDGSASNLKSLAGENGLILVFSCNTCPFVIGNEDFPGWERQYNDLYAQAAAKNVGFVLVNSNEAQRDGVDSMEEMIEHARLESYKMPYVIDTQHALADALGAKTTPHVYAFDKELRLVYKGSIDNSWDSKREADANYLSDVIVYLGGGMKLKTHSTPPRGCSIKRITL
ncbi:MAG: hypothetical protein A3D92_15160 [Bacteroidetes bacterium RIFCSPHIGHO2_02_FULL_44_7]|nr:MAG: hypothetical protein A3D92_15160 [Bacteroidetes bacterium RIFCSPHIGHO2_02_FULL_44_7]